MNVETMPSLGNPPAGLAEVAPEQVFFAGRVLAFTYDDCGRCDGFVLDLGCNREFCFECREPEIEGTLRRALKARRSMTVLAAAAAPRRPLAILP